MKVKAYVFAAGFVLMFGSHARGEPPVDTVPAPVSGTSPAFKTCPVKAEEAFVRARANGYQFEGERTKGEGQCLVNDGFPSFIGRAGAQELECRFRAFAGPVLKGAWRLTAASFAGDPFVLLKPTSESTAQPSGTAPVELVLRVPERSDRKVVLSSIELSGPDCGRWREAF